MEEVGEASQEPPGGRLVSEAMLQPMPEEAHRIQVTEWEEEEEAQSVAD